MAGAIYSLIPGISDDQRRLIAAFTELAEAMRATHWAEVDEDQDTFRGYCSCESVGFPRRETQEEAEVDVLRHLAAR